MNKVTGCLFTDALYHFSNSCLIEGDARGGSWGGVGTVQQPGEGALPFPQVPVRHPPHLAGGGQA